MSTTSNAKFKGLGLDLQGPPDLCDKALKRQQNFLWALIILGSIVTLMLVAAYLFVPDSRDAVKSLSSILGGTGFLAVIGTVIKKAFKANP